MNLFKVQLNSGFSLCVFCPLCVCWLIDVFLACALTFILKHVLICHHYLPLLFSAPWGINSSPHSCIFLPSTSPLFRILVLTLCFIKKKNQTNTFFLTFLQICLWFDWLDSLFIDGYFLLWLLYTVKLLKNKKYVHCKTNKLGMCREGPECVYVYVELENWKCNNKCFTTFCTRVLVSV